MRGMRSWSVLVLLAVGLLCSLPASAITSGQVDTFEDGTTQGWLVGLLGAPSPAPPVNIPTGGPAGVDDNYLLLTALGGNGPGSKLAAINLAQWAGDYTASGVKYISMDLYNFGTNDLSLRLLIDNPLGGPPTDAVVSTTPVLLSAGSGWTRARFGVDLGSLITLFGDGSTALSTATELRLFHSPDVNFPGPAVVASLGVDNITAVPEPASGFALGMGLLGLLLHRRKQSAP
ncbi:MAG: PEP-CTERM sorting domain-containing protein [Armatimonadetes bacterium]|nr:PEP-CTERM sorting domain-containing protein [Armatimonadota bacterium]